MTDLRLMPLAPADAEALWARLHANEPANIYAIADLEHFGWSSPTLQFTGIYRGAWLVGHIMRYGVNASAAYDDDAAAGLVVSWLRRSRVRYVSGLQRYWEPVLTRLQPEEVVRLEPSLLARLPAGRFRPEALQRHDGHARRATLDDLDAVTAVHVSAPDQFTSLDYTTRRETLRTLMTDGWRRLYLAETADGRVVAAAQTGAEARDLAVIGGVVTDPAYRGQGHSTACTAALCRDLLAEQKVPYLFYSKRNTPAARVYANIGFEPVDDWTLAEIDLQPL